MERERIFKRDKKGRKRKREVAQEKERAKEAGRKTQCYFFASNFIPSSFPLSFRPTISLFIDIPAWDCLPLGVYCVRIKNNVSYPDYGLNPGLL